MYLITGMHRSGTSIVARLFFKAGADMGDPGHFYPGDRWNPDGYFEQPDIHSVNMPLINGKWGKLSYFFLPSEKKIIQRSEKFSEQIQKISSDYRDKVVKETRFCLTLQAWLKHGADIKKILVNIREPVQVALSLKKRNHIPVKLGLHLWYEHNRRLLKYAQGIPVCFLDYNRLLNTEYSLSELKRALNFLSIPVSDEKVTALIRTFVKPSMNHNRTNGCVYEDHIGKLWADLQQRSGKD